MATATAVTPPKFYDGSDYNTFRPDGTSGLTFDVITDPRDVVAQHILRRWLIEPGQLDIPDIGVGVKKYLNMSMRALEAEELVASMRIQAQEVDGVEDVALAYSQTSINGGGIVLRVSLTVTLSQVLGGQTFDTVFELTQDKVSYIISGQAT